MIDPAFQRQLDQAMSRGPIQADEMLTNWWTRYLVKTNRFTMGYDLCSWALPLNVAIGRANLHLQVLCIDIDFYWGEFYD